MEELKTGVKIRGIYSTSLTKFLLDHGYEIASPSLRIQQRLKITGVPYADTIIYDKEDKNGVVVHGRRAEEIVKLFQEEFLDISVRKVSRGEVYVGVIRDVLTDKKVIVVDLDEQGKFGYLPIKDYWGVIQKGVKVLVQVKGYEGVIPLLTTNLRLFGEDVVLIEKGYSKVSKHLTNRKEIERLLNIGKEYEEKGWGILWKALAENKPEEYLKKEIDELIKLKEELKKKVNEINIGKVMEGQIIYFVDFGYLTKRKLDEIRNTVVPTVKYHHMLRQANVGPIIDFAERLIGKLDKDELENTLMETVWEHSLPLIGKLYSVIHRKVTGTTIKITGRIIEKDFSKRKIVLERIVKKPGVYDGLNLPKEVGDIIKTELVEGRWYIKHEYYSKDGKLKGVYYSINTPLEFYPEGASYLDLEIDVVEINGERKIIDQEKLESIKGKYISEKLAEKAKQIAEFIVKGEFEKCQENI